MFIISTFFDNTVSFAQLTNTTGRYIRFILIHTNEMKANQKVIYFQQTFTPNMKFSYTTSLVFTFYHSNRFDKKCIYVLNLTSPRYSLDFVSLISLCSLCLYTLDYRGQIPLGVLFHLYQYLIANMLLIPYFSD